MHSPRFCEKEIERRPLAIQYAVDHTTVKKASKTVGVSKKRMLFKFGIANNASHRRRAERRQLLRERT